MALVSLRHSFSAFPSPFPPPCPSLPSSPPLPKEGKNSDSHKQNICHSIQGRTEAGAQNILEEMPESAEGLSCLIWKAVFEPPCSVYPGTLPISLTLAPGAPHEEWRCSFREESLTTPQRAGLVMPPLLPSPGGVGYLFQTSISRDISNSLIASQESRGAVYPCGHQSRGFRGKSQH